MVDWLIFMAVVMYCLLAQEYFLLGHFYVYWFLLYYVPIGIFAMSVLMVFLPEDNTGRHHQIDYLGILYLTVSIADFYVVTARKY